MPPTFEDGGGANAGTGGTGLGSFELWQEEQQRRRRRKKKSKGNFSGAGNTTAFATSTSSSSSSSASILSSVSAKSNAVVPLNTAGGGPANVGPPVPPLFVAPNNDNDNNNNNVNNGNSANDDASNERATTSSSAEGRRDDRRDDQVVVKDALASILRHIEAAPRQMPTSTTAATSKAAAAIEEEEEEEDDEEEEDEEESIDNNNNKKKNGNKNGNGNNRTTTAGGRLVPHAFVTETAVTTGAGGGGGARGTSARTKNPSFRDQVGTAASGSSTFLRNRHDVPRGTTTAPPDYGVIATSESLSSLATTNSSVKAVVVDDAATASASAASGDGSTAAASAAASAAGEFESANNDDDDDCPTTTAATTIPPPFRIQKNGDGDDTSWFEIDRPRYGLVDPDVVGGDGENENSGDRELLHHRLHGDLFDLCMEKVPNSELVWGFGRVRMEYECNPAASFSTSERKFEKGDKLRVVVDGPLLEVPVDVEMRTGGRIVVRPKPGTRIRFNYEVIYALMSGLSGDNGEINGKQSRHLAQCNEFLAEKNARDVIPGDPDTYYEFLTNFVTMFTHNGVVARHDSDLLSAAAAGGKIPPGTVAVTPSWVMYSRPVTTTPYCRDAKILVRFRNRNRIASETQCVYLCFQLPHIRCRVTF